MRVPPLRYLLSATVLMLMTFPLHAGTILPNGGTVSPLDGVTVPANIDSFLIDGTGSDFFFAPFAGAPVLAGHVDEVVLHDAFGLTCPTCLDFAFQITNFDVSSFSIYRALFTNLTGFALNVGYALDDGDIIPDSMNRGPLGGGVATLFGTDAAPNLGPGKSSFYFLIATDATSYNTSGVLGLNGSNGGSCTTFDINHCRGGLITDLFAPTNAPEPSSALLLGLGLAGIAALRKRLV